MKKAFSNVSVIQTEDHVVRLTEIMLYQQKQNNLANEKEQARLRQELDREISEMNNPTTQANRPTNQILTRETILLEFDETTEEITEEHDDSLNESCESLTDLEELEGDFIPEFEPMFAYMPCAAHNLQLVIKDGLKLDEEYNKLIEKVSKNIVSKARCCTYIADELRKLNKFVLKSNVTRWNSILFMIRSVLSLSPQDFKTIRSNLPSKNKKQKIVKSNFDLFQHEREMLLELKEVLEIFEFATDELQCKYIF